MKAYCPTCGTVISAHILAARLVELLGAYLTAADVPAITAHDLITRLYPAPASGDAWGPLRAEIARYAPGEAPSPLRLALALRKLRAVTLRGDGLRLVLDGRTAGRARWSVEGLRIGEQTFPG